MTFVIPKKTLVLWRLRVACVFGVLCAVCVVFCRISMWFILPTVIVFAIGSVFVFAFLPKWFKNYKITVSDSVLCISKGVFFKTTSIVPVLRIAFVKTFTTPITSFLKLRCAILKVTRGWIFVPELEDKMVEKLLDVIDDA